MKAFRLLAIAFLLLVLSNESNAQYWFGVKAGSQMSIHDFQTDTYKDSFNVENDINFQTGAMFSYTASSRYSVHVEMYYKKVRRDLENTFLVLPARSYLITHNLSIPAMLRINFPFGNSGFGFHVNGGIELNYWLAGRGGLDLDEFQEFFSEEELEPDYPLEYNLVFYRRARKDENDLYMTDANRLQYAVTAGVGFSYELRGGSRFLVDLRYTHAHSNLGFNTSPDLQWVDYEENFESRPHQIGISIGYQLQYDAQLARKGKSTLRDSNR